MNDTLTPNSTPPADPETGLTAPLIPADSPASMADDQVREDAAAGPGDAAPQTASDASAPARTGKSRRTHARAADVLPVLERLAGLCPPLFGANFRPLKRGIYQDLLAAHPDAFEADALKAALGYHTRSTRYLSSVAAGHPRHDLQGKPVEDMAPEHIHQALLEVFRRRQGRGGGDDVRARTVARMAQAFETSNMSREAWRELLQSRDDAANALLDEALAQVAAAAARDEALLRAFEASGRTVAAFAGDYGLKAGEAEATLQRARNRRTPVASASV